MRVYLNNKIMSCFGNRGDEDCGKVYLYDNIEEEKRLVKTLEIHSQSVRFILFNKVYNCCVSIDKRGFIELWDPETLDFPKNDRLSFKVKIDTDYFELLKKKTFAVGACLSPNGEYLAIASMDKQVRLFKFASGKLIATIDESDKRIQEVQDSQDEEQNKLSKLDKFDFSRRMALERDVDKTLESNQLDINNVSIQFDENNEILVYSTLIGVKYYSIGKKKVVFVQGKNEGERFLKFCLY